MRESMLFLVCRFGALFRSLATVAKKPPRASCLARVLARTVPLPPFLPASEHNGHPTSNLRAEVRLLPGPSNRSQIKVLLRRWAEVLLLVDQPVEGRSSGGRSDAMERDDLLKRVAVGVEADRAEDSSKPVSRIDGVVANGVAEFRCVRGGLHGLSHRLQDDFGTGVGSGGVVIGSHPVCGPEALLEVRADRTDRRL